MALRRDVGKYSPVSTRAPENDAAPVDRTPSARRGVWLAIAVAIGWLLISSWAGPLAGQLSQVQENDNAFKLDEHVCGIATRNNVDASGTMFGRCSSPHPRHHASMLNIA